MKRLAQWFSQLNPHSYLRLVVLAVVVLTFANLLVSATSFEIGMGYPSIVAGPGDRFGDLVKFSLSYKKFTSGIGNSAKYRSWAQTYKHFYESNEYGGKEHFGERSKITHFHVPPFSTLLFLGAAMFIAATNSVYPVMLVFFSFYLLLMQWAVERSVPKEKRSWKLRLAFCFFVIVSYPALAVFSRANYHAGFTSLLVIGFLFSVFGRKQAGWVEFLALAIAINIRPNAAIFALAIPLLLGLKQSFGPLLKIAVSAIGIFFVSYVAVHALYPDYTLQNFYRGVADYNEKYVIGDWGAGGNNSLYGIIQNFNQLDTGKVTFYLAGLLLVLLTGPIVWAGRRVKRWTVTGPLILLTVECAAICLGYHKHSMVHFQFLALVVAALVGWSVLRSPERLLAAPFFLTALYCLLTPVFAPYHLLVFVAPLFLVYFDAEHWEGHSQMFSIIVLACVLMLSPKNYILGGSDSPQVVLNPLLLFVLTLALAAELLNSPKRAELRVRSD